MRKTASTGSLFLLLFLSIISMNAMSTPTFLPPLPNVTWQKISYDQTKQKEFEITIYENGKMTPVYSYLPGELWIATLKNLSDEEYKELNKEWYYFLEDRRENEKTWEITVENKKIQALIADGIGNSIEGFMKYDHNTITQLQFQNNTIDYIETSKQNEPLEFKCPCTVVLKVFVSQMNLKTFIHYINNPSNISKKSNS